VLDYFMSGGNPNSSPQSTTVGIHGQVQAIPTPANGSGVKGHVVLGAGGVPVTAAGAVATNLANHARGNGIFWQSPREARIGFETRTPTPLGEVRTVMEFDWAGSTTFAPGGANPTSVSDNLVPRLRYGYG